MKGPIAKITGAEQGLPEVAFKIQIIMFSRFPVFGEAQVLPGMLNFLKIPLGQKDILMKNRKLTMKLTEY